MKCVLFPVPSSCGSPDKNINTTIDGNNYNIGAVIKYNCPTGHMTVGSKNRTCGNDGFWTGSPPSCKCMFLFETLKRVRNSLKEFQ